MVFERIAEYMDEVGTNKAAVARKIGMSKQTLYQCLSGERNITADEYVDLCNVLQVPLDRFAKPAKKAS
jgi:transcriptional regulator with XRE-family HTH domain